MCGFENNTLSVPLGGKTTVRSYQPILKWNDPRLQKPADSYMPAQGATDGDASAGDEQTGLARGENLMLQKRRVILATLWRLYPMGNGAAIGQPAPFQGPVYKKMEGWADGRGTSCTFTNPKIVKGASGDIKLPGAYDVAPAPDYDDPILKDANGKPVRQKGSKGHPAWVPYAKGKLPSVGDTYILTGSKTNAGLKSYGRFLHVGTIVHVDTSDGAYWITADGGQNDKYTNGQAAHLVRRKYECKTDIKNQPEAPHFSGGAEGDDRRIHGWLDIGDPRIVFADSILRDPQIDEDYKKLGEWIERAIANTT